jgi:DNA-binding CsgD family transcriptional regulator
MSRSLPSAHVATKPAATALISAGLGSVMFCDQAWDEIRRSLRLSDRELEIVRRMFDDEKEFAIADNLGIAPRTVHTHIERLYRKLGLTDRGRLLVRVMQEFLTLTACPGKNLPPVCANRTCGRCPLQRPAQT